MKPQKIDKLFQVVVLGMLVISSASALASTGSCSYSVSGTGIGGTGAPVAGNVISSQGVVNAQSGGSTRSLATGDAVCVGETIVTAKSATAQIKMVDDGMVTVRPQTEFKIEKFTYTGTEQDNSMFALLKGALRVVTGKLGHKYPQNDLIRTPLALIGVRGTDHEVAVILPGQAGNSPAGVYDKVNTGITYIKTDAGEIDIHQNQVGFAAAAGDLPVLLKEVPDFYGTVGLHEGGSATEGGEGGRDEHGGPGGHESGAAGVPEGGGREHPNVERPNLEHPNIDHPEIDRPEAPETPELPERPSGGD